MDSNLNRNPSSEISASAQNLKLGASTEDHQIPKASPHASPAPSPAIWDRLPPWVTTNLRSSRSWKLWFRSWFASWAALIILLPKGSLLTLGTAGFFSLLTSLFLPPYLPFQMFFFIISTMVIGMLLGWSIGAAAMCAALAARDKVLLASSLETAKQSVAGLANPELMFTFDIFQGKFLDTRSSIVFGCFLGLAGFIFGLIRAYAPKLIFMSIFGTIAVDIFCTYGPLFPFAHYTLINSLLTSVACYIAIALLLTTFIFPQSMNHVCLTSTSDLLEKIHTLIAIQDTVLESSSEDLANGRPLMVKILGLRAAMMGGIKSMMAQSAFINLEFSVGMWNGHDVRALEEPLLGIVTRCAGLQTFARLVGNGAADIYESPDDTSASNSVSSTNTAPSSNAKDTYLLRQIHLRNSALEQQHSLTIQDLLPTINEATRDLREACAAGIVATKATIDLVNQCRWRRNPDVDAQRARELEAAIERLTATLTEFTETKRKALIDPFLPFIKAARTKEEHDVLPLRSLYLSYVFAANLMSVANVILEFMDKVRETTGKRKKNRLWAPRELRAIAKLITRKGDKEEGDFGEETSPQPDAAEMQDEAAYRRDPDSSPPRNVVQKSANATHRLWLWCKTAEAAFVFKYVLLSVALFLPAVFTSSASFYYDQKGVWALIMAQTTLNLYASDQIYNYVTRLIGTLIGLAFGLVTWYVGNGTGFSPYGLAASSAVFLMPVVWLRLYAPQQYSPAVVLGCATFALVIGYSIVDGHLQQVASPGIGWSVAWRRWVLVLIGCAASFVVMIIPPQSGRKAVRIRNAYAIMGLSNIYAFLISHWITDQSHERIGKHDQAPANWTDDFRLRLVSISDEITYVRQLTGLAKWEGNLRGRWPVEEYTELVNTEAQMIIALAQLGGAIGQMSDDWRRNFVHNTKALNPNFIGDVMSMFSLVSQSLRTGEPMHQVLPQALLDRLFYHHQSAVLTPTSDKKKNVIDHEEAQSVDYMYYACGLVAVYQVLQSLDELHRITKRLCGEVPLKGFDRWREEYERTHSKV